MSPALAPAGRAAAAAAAARGGGARGRVAARAGRSGGAAAAAAALPAWTGWAAAAAVLAAGAPFEARAAPAASRFDGTYADTNHPGCARTISDGVLSGEDPVPFVPAPGDGTPGSPCTPGGETKPWSIRLKEQDERAGTVFINFDEKDGSGEAFTARLTADGGLRINDTTLWPRLE